MTFSPDIGFWSPFIFWFCIVNAFASTLFILVVIVGGIRDLQFLLRALREESVDVTDDGRVSSPPDQPTPTL